MRTSEREYNEENLMFLTIWLIRVAWLYSTRRSSHFSLLLRLSLLFSCSLYTLKNFGRISNDNKLLVKDINYLNDFISITETLSYYDEPEAKRFFLIQFHKSFWLIYLIEIFKYLHLKSTIEQTIDIIRIMYLQFMININDVQLLTIYYSIFYMMRS